MCGRFCLDTDDSVIRSFIDQCALPDTTWTQNQVRPTDPAPVLTMTNEQVTIRSMRWGFVHWNTRSLTINARVEGVEGKPLFREAVKNRCIIPASAYMEWQDNEHGRKTAFRIRRPDESVLFMAGFYKVYPAEVEIFEERFVIITTQAVGTAAEVHDRMPLILDRQDCRKWLRGDAVSVFPGTGVDMVVEAVRKPTGPLLSLEE